MRKCTIRVAKTKALISFAVTAKLICVFVFAYADCWFSHGAAQIVKTGRDAIYFECFYFSANSESESYHRAPSAPHAYYVLDMYSDQVCLYPVYDNYKLHML